MEKLLLTTTYKKNCLTSWLIKGSCDFANFWISVGNSSLTKSQLFLYTNVGIHRPIKLKKRIYNWKILNLKAEFEKCGTLSRSENFANIEQNLNL